MKLASTRSPEQIVSFRDAIFQGLAPDGGLYQPVSTPDLSRLFDRFDASSTFLEIATALCDELLADDCALAREFHDRPA